MFWNFPATLLLSCWLNTAMSALQHPYNATNNTRWPLTPRPEPCRCHYARQSRDVCRTVETWHQPCVSPNWRLSSADCVRNSGQGGEVRTAAHVSTYRGTRLAGTSPVLQCFIHPNGEKVLAGTRFHSWQNTNIQHWRRDCCHILHIWMYPDFISAF